MSLYALMPGPALASTKMAGSALSDIVKQQSPFFPDPPKPKPVDPLSKLTIDANLKNISRNNSFSSVSTNGEFPMIESGNSLMFQPATEHEMNIKVEEAMFNFKRLIRPSQSSGRASVSRRSRDSRLVRRVRGEAKTSLFDFDTNENAVEFRLLISFAGRTYCTKRTLLQIAQFRQNLEQELQWADQRRKRIAHDDSECDESQSLKDSSHDSSNEDKPTETVPSLPRLADSSFGVYCAGFAQMSSQLDSYRPMLETWFDQILAEFRESPILADFLWEPLDCNCNIDALHASFTSLGIIEEK